MSGVNAEEFQAWLAMQEALMDEFETEDVPELPTDHYSADGLRIAEAALLREFPNFDATQRHERSKELLDKFARYLGETVRQTSAATGV